MKTLLIIPFLFICSLVIGQTYNSDSIIGKPIKIGNLLFAQNDFPYKLNWEDAKKSCTALGNDWRLPNEDELNTLYITNKNRGKIGGFANEYYWSGTESDKKSVWGLSLASVRNLNDGGSDMYNKNVTFYVRAVRAF